MISKGIHVTQITAILAVYIPIWYKVGLILERRELQNKSAKNSLQYRMFTSQSRRIRHFYALILCSCSFTRFVTLLTKDSDSAP